MARRKNSSVFEDLFGIAALLPWWAGVALAVIAYGVLHRYAVAEVPVQAVPGQVGNMVVAQIGKMLATYGQYIVPLVLLAGAGVSFFKRRKREGLMRSVGGEKSGDALRSMSWRDFELLVGEAFRMRGYAVEETGGGGADGGIDLRLTRGGEHFLVQCKQWRATKVSVTVVRELLGVMTAKAATGGFVVTTGEFTADAKAFVKGHNIELLDGKALVAMIGKARAAAAASRPVKPPPAEVAEPSPPSPPAPHAPHAAVPSCPRCGSAMLKRIAKQGPNAGGAFWGCSVFPDCRGVRAVQ